jgi:hypothetical protein
MPHVTMEYAIMVPILILQVVLMPLAASWMIDVWVTRRRETGLLDVASHMGSTINQLYFSLNRDEVAAGTTTQSANVPPFIESIPYVVTVSDRKIENSTVIDLYLGLMGVGVTATTRVTLGPNVLWEQSTFVSNATTAGIQVVKLSNGTLSFSFV